jgi:phosphoribosylformylglycinamidine synthase
VEPKKHPVLKDVPAPNDLKAAILKIVGSPDMCSRRWVWEQYDSLIGSNTAQIPGGDAGVVRIRDKKAIAVSTDVTPRYVEADPFEGGKQAVAECWRNLTAVGADPIAITDNLNFGNPERPEIMGQFVHAIKGLSEACNALSFPIVSGNVSLYNETNGQGILPTPAIGGIGLIPDLDRMATIPFKADGEAIILIGGHGSHLGQSIYLREVLGREEGAPPPVDLATEKKHGDFVRGLIRSARVTAVHDVSDGGLALAVIEMAMASGFGAALSPLTHEQFFGEDQARYVVTGSPAILEEARKAGIPASQVGTVTAEARLKIASGPSISVADLRTAHEGWFPAYMAGEL